MEPKRWYMCDPAKNTACKKRSCKENPTALFPICDRTSNPAYAVLNEANQHMEADREIMMKMMENFQRDLKTPDLEDERRP